MFCRNNLANQYIVGQYLLGLNKGKHLDYDIHPRSKLIQPTVHQLKVRLDIIREHPLASSPRRSCHVTLLMIFIDFLFNSDVYTHIALIGVTRIA